MVAQNENQKSSGEFAASDENINIQKLKISEEKKDHSL
jgi:hypothetical protein